MAAAASVVPPANSRANSAPRASAATSPGSLS
ncbi:hypothetical protein O974_25155 [Mycobacterium avium 11-0986]|nr:hypothetical protein O974_25155 [Mycobacterium avium 11-0986]